MKKTEELLDKLGEHLTEEELQVTEELYHQALKLQLEFFASVRITQRSVVPFSRMLDHEKSELTIFADFDMACLHGEPSAVLSFIKSAFPTKANSLEILSAWYKEQFAHCVKDIMASKPGPINNNLLA